MKIIDFKKKGQSVRFYLGKQDLESWHGDDWNDIPYEHNAGTVYDEYISGYTDITFDFDDLVLEPCDDWNTNSNYCKDDMAARLVPCIIVVPKEIAKQSWNDTFSKWIGAEGIKKYYFGDTMSAEYIVGDPKRGSDYELIATPALN